jgi:hypothetical protein
LSASWDTDDDPDDDPDDDDSEQSSSSSTLAGSCCVSVKNKERLPPGRWLNRRRLAFARAFLEMTKVNRHCVEIRRTTITPPILGMLAGAV